MMASSTNVKSWSPEEVADWLQNVGFESYVPFFLSNEMDGEALLALQFEELMRLVKLFGETFKMGAVMKFNGALNDLRKGIKKVERAADFGRQNSVAVEKVDRATSPITIITTNEGGRGENNNGNPIACGGSNPQNCELKEPFERAKTASPTVCHQNVDLRSDKGLQSPNAATRSSSTPEKDRSGGETRVVPIMKSPSKVETSPTASAGATGGGKENVGEMPPAGTSMKENSQQSSGSSSTVNAAAASAASASAASDRKMTTATTPTTTRTTTAAAAAPYTFKVSNAHYTFNYPMPPPPFPVLDRRRAMEAKATGATPYLRGYISYADSPMEFSMLMENEAERVRKIGQDLNRFYETDPYVLPLPADRAGQPGTACAVKFDQDGQWYRAEILRAPTGPEGMAKIRYVDYGNCQEVPKSALYCLKRDRLCESPPLRVDCRLADVPANTPITEQQKDEFNDMADPMERMFLVKLDQNVRQPPYVVNLTDLVANFCLNGRVRQILGLEPAEDTTRTSVAAMHSAAFGASGGKEDDGGIDFDYWCGGDDSSNEEENE